MGVLVRMEFGVVQGYLLWVLDGDIVAPEVVSGKDFTFDGSRSEIIL